MAPRYQVTCITPDAADIDQRIDAIGGTSGGGWKLLIDEAIRQVEARESEFFTHVNGYSADVVVGKRPNGRKYLTTTADGVEPNNLLALPRCP